MTFDEIEDCFPDGGIYETDDGAGITTSAQWLHDFARNVANKECESLRLQLAIVRTLRDCAEQDANQFEQQLTECKAREKVLRDALTAIIDQAQESTDQYHESMKGYRQARHDRMDADIQLARDALAMPSDSTALDEALKQAVAAEREACAKVCENSVYGLTIDEWNGMTKKEHGAHAGRMCAEQIRAR